MQNQSERRVAFDGAHILPRKYRNVQNIPHFHREHELVTVLSGSASVLSYGNSFILREGASAFLCDGEIHSIRSEAEATVLVAKFDPDYFGGIVRNRRLISPLLEHTPHIQSITETVCREIADAAQDADRIADSLATVLIAYIFRYEASETRSCVRTETEKNHKKLLDMITEQYAFITFDEAAEAMHFSRPYFSKYFYRNMGMTFSRYLNMIRIANAVEKVRAGHDSMTEISRSCGFNTIRNFNRVFRELTGYPPSALPENYIFANSAQVSSEEGFDPTLACTEILPL